MSLLERDIQAAFERWLAIEGWSVATYSADGWLDVYAERGDERLLAEVKRKTGEPAVDADIAYGQLLRRMPAEEDPRLRFALVVPDWPRSVRAATRVPARVRATLRVIVYAVDAVGTVRVVDS
jgi:hypothetical protein